MLLTILIIFLNFFLIKILFVILDFLSHYHISIVMIMIVMMINNVKTEQLYLLALFWLKVPTS